MAYTADANYASGSATYDNLSLTLGKVEDNIWWDEAQLAVIATPAFKRVLRAIKDSSGNPIFLEGARNAGGSRSATP